MNLILLLGQGLFLLLLYLFLWRAVRVILADLKAQARLPAPRRAGRMTGQLVVLRGEQPARGERFVLSSPIITIGRSPANELPVQDRFASAEHARISARDGYYWLEDLGSSNGTFVNGQKISESVPLQHGDKVEVGDTVFRFEETA